MRLTLIMFCLCLFTVVAFSQVQTQNVAAVGVSFNPGGSPKVAGTGLWARLVSGNGTYAYTVVDALPSSAKPYTITTQVSAGMAQKLFSINGIDILVPTAAGVSWTGTNVGWSWTSGGIVAIKYKQARIMPNVRFLKSSVSNGAGYQVIAGILFGWGF